MPTIDRWQGFRFYFHSHEPNEPPHVHVDRQGATAKFWLRPVALASSTGFAPRDLTRLLRYVRENADRFVEAWDGHLGA